MSLSITTARANHDASIRELRNACQRFKDAPPNTVDDRLAELLAALSAVRENKLQLARLRAEQKEPTA